MPRQGGGVALTQPPRRYRSRCRNATLAAATIAQLRRLFFLFADGVQSMLSRNPPYSRSVPRHNEVATNRPLLLLRGPKAALSTT